MSTRKERLSKRNEHIRAEYNKLSKKRQKGRKKSRLYSVDTILEKLGEKFFISPRTIDDIICGRSKP